MKVKEIYCLKFNMQAHNVGGSNSFFDLFVFKRVHAEEAGMNLTDSFKSCGNFLFLRNHLFMVTTQCFFSQILSIMGKR